ncbi:hypothetical protein [Hydrogenophaga sp. PBL-H3]|uniref:hypothetical protein n=1 Tax=Hydrogenophaga sp. PBL-H3 TaxID=434010 RepID=UPI00131FB8D0|nr:hypothetical protein [Hydrogenophaga sp. PBL-H3]QHE76294.1 hypothetical protein F9Z45_09615 [Hydrogenophaga sp. PBL-H3]QHE80718.1 hypothetical protein F9Z44_09615 [Hydrogenophaga sp. PBL-H3]
MEKSTSSDEHSSGHEAGNPANMDPDLRAFIRIFGTLPDDLEMPPLPLTPVGQGLAQLSHRDRLSLSRPLGNNPPNSPRPATPRLDITLVPTPRDTQGMVNEGATWVTKLMVQMRALSELSDDNKVQLLSEVPSLEGARALATQDTLAKVNALAGRRWRTSLYSALVMYWLTFGLGKVVGNSFGAAMVACGLPAAALYAPLFTMLGVPFTQVIFGEPYGGALRSAGVSYGSPDQAAYINYQTAHALYIRAWLEDNKADEEKYRKIMNGIVDGLIKREQARKPDGSSRIPRRLRSNASVPDRNPDGTVKPGHADPSQAVVGAARTRSFITDEVPVHTFTVLNGMSGFANLFWKLFMGSAVTRVPDMVAHTVMGSIAMVSMFEWQNVWRAKFQGVDLSDGGHPAVLGAQKEAARVTLDMWSKRYWDALSLIKKIEDMLGRVDDYRKSHDASDVHWNDIHGLEATLMAAKGQLRESLGKIMAASRLAKKQLNTLTTRGARANVAAKMIMSSMVGESSAAEPWLTGAPMRIRSVSRVLGYMTVLGATATQAILLGMSLTSYAQQLQEGREMTAHHPNDTLVTAPLNALGLTSDQMAVASFNASTIACTAIVGWTAKTLYGLPLWEHGIHGIAGIATRAIKETRKCLGLAPDLTLPVHADPTPDNPFDPVDIPAYSSDEEDHGLPPLPKVNIEGSSSSSSSNSHH